MSATTTQGAASVWVVAARAGVMVGLLAACGDSGVSGLADAGDDDVTDAAGDDDPLPVALQTATATFSQTAPPIFLVGAAIDGVVDNGTGWAIEPATTAQTAAFETVADTPAYAGGSSRLTFTLDHRFVTEHALGKFRLAYTTASRDAFADGVDGSGSAPGDVGDEAIWTVLTPTTAASTSAAAMRINGDGSILAEDLDSTDAVYTVVATAPDTGLTGVRLEVLEDPSLPFDGPGAQDSNGNFVLAEFSVSVAAP